MASFRRCRRSRLRSSLADAVSACRLRSSEVVAHPTDDEFDALLVLRHPIATPGSAAFATTRSCSSAAQTGLRVSEITSLTCGDVELGTGAHVRCRGKGRKQRITLLTTQVCAVLRAWLATKRCGTPTDAAFPSRRGGPLSSDAVAFLVTKHARAAAIRRPSIGNKSVTPHVLRPSAPHPAAIAPRTRCSPSWTPRDYADFTSPKPLSHKGFRALLGITHCSA